MSEITREQEIAQIEMAAPHVVLLGAGASRAAFPKGERSGRRLPLMADFSEIVPIGEVLEPAGIRYRGENFEQLYSELAGDKREHAVCSDLEALVYRYFESLSLPDEPTLYDHLILSLRAKDVIATFNWDPFLIQAARRNSYAGDLPRLIFLHGNVLAGYCATDSVHGVKGAACTRCGRRFALSRLLYPTSEKAYDDDPMIRDAWRALKYVFERAFMVTVFGYGAPQTDRAAIDALKQAWGSPENRPLEQFEIVDIRSPDQLRDSWDAFIHTHHYEIHADPYRSWVFNHPRRTGEAYINQYFNAAFIEDNPIPRELDHRELRDWFKPCFAAERLSTHNKR